MVRALALVAFVVVALVGAAPAHARRAVVAIASFEGGRPAKAFRTHVLRAIKKKYKVVAWSKRNRADAVMTGRVNRRGSRYSVRVEMSNPDTDEILGECKFRDRRTRLRPSTRRELLDELSYTISETRRDRRQQRQRQQEDEENFDDEEEALAVRQPKAERSRDKQQPTPRAAAKRAAPRTQAEQPVARVAVEQRASRPVEREVDPEPEVAPERELTGAADVSASLDSDAIDSGPAVAARVSAGVSFINRSLAVGASDEDFASYEGIYAPGLHVDGDLVVNHKVGLEAYYDRSVGLKSGRAGAGTMPLATAQSRLEAAAFYRASFAGDRVAFHIGVGGGRVAFGIEKSALITDQVPDVSHTFIGPVMAVRVGITDRIAAVARGSGLVVLSSGELSDSAQYGSASTFGYDVMAGADIEVFAGFGVRAGATFTRMSMSFDRNGTLDAGSGSDQYTGSYVGANYAF